MNLYELYKDVEETQERLKKQIDVVLQCESDLERSAHNGETKEQ